MSATDTEIEFELLSKIAGNKAISGLVKQMQPLDIAKCLQSAFDLQPKKAAHLTINLLVNMKLHEWSMPGIETNKQYPVPNRKIDNEDEVPNSKVQEDFYNPKPETPTTDAQFPPKPRSNSAEFPYDSNTLFITDPKIKGQKRPLMQGYEPTSKSNKEPGGSGLGIFQKATPNVNQNSTPDIGSSWDKNGVAGWSRSLQYKEFDLPE
jgi:hypothetical protein